MLRFTRHAWADEAWYCLDCSPLLPPGTRVANLTVAIFSATSPRASHDADFLAPIVTATVGRRLYFQLHGGATDTDYLLQLSFHDSNGQYYTRSALLLCADTS